MTPLPLVLTLVAVVTAYNNTTAEYKLQTRLRLADYTKLAYDGLYLSSYHTGAGLNDVVFTDEAPLGNASLAATNITVNGTTYYNQLFDLGNDFPWGLVMVPNQDFYAAWQPVQLNAGASGSAFDVSGFFINETGLQWTSNPDQVGTDTDEFGGWLVCDWWHGVPQLFFRISYYSSTAYEAPASCADVYLIPQYL